MVDDMKGKVSHTKRNVGSDPTPEQINHGANTSMGTNKSVRTRGGRGSFEGYHSGSRTDIISRDAGYMSKANQNARNTNKNPINIEKNYNQVSFIRGRNDNAITTLGTSYSGSSKILYNRMKLNRI